MVVNGVYEVMSGAITTSVDRSKPPELYNLKRDPMEQDNVIQDEPKVARDLELEIRKFVDNVTLHDVA